MKADAAVYPLPSRRAGQFVMRIRPARMWDNAPKEEASQISIDPAPARIPAAGLRYVPICLHMKGSWAHLRKDIAICRG